MTKWEILRHNQIKEVLDFLNKNHMQAWELAKISKELCACGTCKFYVQHYDKDQNSLDWGHCCKSNRESSKKPNTSACAFWEDGVAWDYLKEISHDN